jgi:hypothetical protein
MCVSAVVVTERDLTAASVEEVDDATWINGVPVAFAEPRGARLLITADDCPPPADELVVAVPTFAGPLGLKLEEDFASTCSGYAERATAGSLSSLMSADGKLGEKVPIAFPAVATASPGHSGEATPLFWGPVLAAL